MTTATATPTPITTKATRRFDFYIQCKCSSNLQHVSYIFHPCVFMRISRLHTNTTENLFNSATFRANAIQNDALKSFRMRFAENYIGVRSNANKLSNTPNTFVQPETKNRSIGIKRNFSCVQQNTQNMHNVICNSRLKCTSAEL